MFKNISVLVALSLIGTAAYASSQSEGQIAEGSVFLLQLHVGQGNMTLKQRADVVQERLPDILGMPGLSPSDVHDVKQGNQYNIMVGSHLLVTCTAADAKVNNVSVQKQAMMWMDSLKKGLMEVKSGGAVPVSK